MKIAAAFALALLACGARALPAPHEPEPEWKGAGAFGYCAGLASRNMVLAPAIEDSPQLLQRIQSGMAQSVYSTNECARAWDLMGVLRSTVAAAVRAESDPVLGVYARSGWTVRWEEVPLSKLEAEVAGTPAPRGRFDDVCRGVVEAFRRLTGEEREMYFRFRRSAVADAVWGSLVWSPPSAAP